MATSDDDLWGRNMPNCAHRSSHELFSHIEFPAKRYLHCNHRHNGRGYHVIGARRTAVEMTGITGDADIG